MQNEYPWSKSVYYLKKNYRKLFSNSQNQWHRNKFESGGEGANVRRKAPEIFFGSTSTISRFVSTFVMVGTIWSVSCSLLYSWCSAICKSGGGARPPVPNGVGATG